jgi:hypothetical protein
VEKLLNQQPPAVQRYISKPSEIVAWRGTGTETPMEIVNSFFRQRYEHQFLYDWSTIEKMLLRAGFDQVSRVSFGVAIRSPSTVLDAEKYQWESLYVEALKG